MSRLSPLYVFEDAGEWYRRHSSGVELEFKNESKEIKAFNSRQHKFTAWAIARLHRGKEKTLWVFLVRPGEGAAEHLFPKEGETCEMLLWTKSGKTKRWEKYWEAERIENPAASFGIAEGPAHRMHAFKLKVPNNVPDDIIRPLADDLVEVGRDASNPLAKKHALGDKKAYRVTMQLRLSSATHDAEMGALDRLFKNPQGSLSLKQEAAFKYMLNFRSIPFTVNMFNHFPHLRDPNNNPGEMPPKVIDMLKSFNDHQRDAYKAVLSNLPCGVGIIPGGPGAGKTHWNLVVTAAVQSKNVFWHTPNNCSEHSAKVLYVLDINKPLDDTCNKIVKLYKSLGLKKRAVRLYGWRYGSEAGETSFYNKFIFTARMNRFRRQSLNETCLAPTLDELVWDFFQANKKDRYRDISVSLSKVLNHSKIDDLPAWRNLVNQLYKDVLTNHVDFIATTPVPAATGFGGLFKPEIVIFDESPHAREASTMIAVAKFEPIAWIFSGDHRQTRPFVASDDARDNYWAPQMLVSMMERADRAGAVRHSLLINHRAYGRLEQLASKLFYDKRVVSGHKEEDLFPPSISHLRRYLERFLPPGQACLEPRLLVYDGNRAETKEGTSWFNPSHISWVMDCLQELLVDTNFKQVGKQERGTILIISPYKESYMRYKKAIRDMSAKMQTKVNVERRVEARTIDTVQGGEADLVFLDMVRSVATDFTDDPNRLNVAVTRARQAEIILMHPDMCRGSFHLSRVFAHCHAMGQVIDITKQKPRQTDQVSGDRLCHQKHIPGPGQAAGERVASSLLPGPPQPGDQNPQPALPGDQSSLEDGQVQSTLAPQFAGLADFMQSILDEKRTKGLQSQHAASNPPSAQAQTGRGGHHHMHTGTPPALSVLPTPAVPAPAAHAQGEAIPAAARGRECAVGQGSSAERRQTGLARALSGESSTLRQIAPAVMVARSPSGLRTMPDGHAEPSSTAQAQPSRARHILAFQEGASATVRGADRSGGGKNRELTSDLPSGSSWW